MKKWNGRKRGIPEDGHRKFQICVKYIKWTSKKNGTEKAKRVHPVVIPELLQTKQMTTNPYIDCQQPIWCVFLVWNLSGLSLTFCVSIWEGKEKKYVVSELRCLIFVILRKGIFYRWFVVVVLLFWWSAHSTSLRGKINVKGYQISEQKNAFNILDGSWFFNVVVAKKIPLHIFSHNIWNA